MSQGQLGDNSDTAQEHPEDTLGELRNNLGTSWGHPGPPHLRDTHHPMKQQREIFGECFPQVWLEGTQCLRDGVCWGAVGGVIDRTDTVTPPGMDKAGGGTSRGGSDGVTFPVCLGQDEGDGGVVKKGLKH